MREILFRGKTAKDKEWVYGDLLNVGVDYDYAIRIYGGREHGQVNAVNEKTIGQFTGLTDKNGKKIFEGDICLVCRETVTMQGITEQHNGAFGLRYKSGEFNSLLYLNRSRPEGRWFDTLEVIGNIHDNPELLKEA